MFRAGHQAGIGQHPRKIQAHRRRLRKLDDLCPGVAAGHDLDRDTPGLARWCHFLDSAVDLDRARAGIKREVERLQVERLVDVRAGPHGGSGCRAEQRHLQLSFFGQLEAVFGARRLPNDEADLFAPVIDAVPDRRRPVTGKVLGEETRRGLQVAAVDQDHHAPDPCHHDRIGRRPRDRSRQWPDEPHSKPCSLSLAVKVL